MAKIRIFTLLLLSFFIVGCKSETVTLEMIDKLIFVDISTVDMMPVKYENSIRLDENEVKILRLSIKNGTKLSSITDKDTPNNFDERYLYLNLMRKSRKGLDLIFDKKTGFMFVQKIQLFDKKASQFGKNLKITESLIGAPINLDHRKSLMCF